MAKHKITKTKSLSGVGVLDAENMTLELDGVEQDLQQLFKMFNGEEVRINITLKEEI